MGAAADSKRDTTVLVKDVCKSYTRGETEVRALRGVDCRIPSGSFTFILGPSGSGKSTLLHLIGALDIPTSGEIRIGNRSLNDFGARERDKYRRNEVGFVFQNFNLLSNLDSVANVLVPFLPTGISDALRKRAVQLLDEVGLGKRLDHRPSQLSGGEQQRVAIARALLKQPSLILADEPTGELDTENGDEIIGYLRRMCHEHRTTVIVVTHDQSRIQQDDCILRMRDGRIEEPS